jgi:hypothetical protein
LQRAVFAPVYGCRLYWILIFSIEGVNYASGGVIAKKEPGSGQLPGPLSRRYLGFWKAEDDGRVFGVPSDGERKGNNAMFPATTLRNNRCTSRAGRLFYSAGVTGTVGKEIRRVKRCPANDREIQKKRRLKGTDRRI